MKTASRRFLVLVFAGTFAAAGARGGNSDGKAVTATATEEQPEEYKNWIELGIGGVITSGDRAAIRTGTPVCRAIKFTVASRICILRGLLDKNGVFSVDGHALWDINDYDITVQLAKPKLRLH